MILNTYFRARILHREQMIRTTLSRVVKLSKEEINSEKKALKSANYESRQVISYFATS